MFEGFANVWTPVALSEELKKDAPLGLQVAGTPVVLFRDREGRAAALVDRCPHRGVALSLGKVKEGCIECPFHGWKLESSGQVCHVPWNPDAKLAGLKGMSVPARELSGVIWMFTSVTEQPAAEPDPGEAMTEAGLRVSGMAVEWKTHWTRAMENMLDWPHLPFVHANTIGRGLRGKSAARMDITWEDRPWGAHTHSQIDGTPQQGSLDFRWPNQMNLHLSIPGKRMVMAVACVPIDQGRTRMLLTMGRDFMKSRIFDWFFNRANLKIALEDQAIVESSFPAEVPPAGDERSVRTDGPTLAFRKRYYAELKGTARAVVEEDSVRRALPVLKAAG